MIIFLLVYFDDILVTSNHGVQIHQLIRHLAQEFSLKDLGSLHYFLGIEVIYDKQGRLMSQTQYIKNLLNQTSMRNCKLVQTHFPPAAKFS